MNYDLTKSIVRVLQKDGTTAGTGFFVSKSGLIATCAHVVSGYQPGEEVFVVIFSSKKKYGAIIEKQWWREPSDEDVAILRILGTSSDEIFSIPLGYPWKIENIPLMTFGFPSSKSLEGLNGKCKVVGRTTVNGCSILQIRSSEVTRGFSGAPVLDPDSNRIVGMITAISKPDQYGRQAETAFITPSDILAHICPRVEEVNIQRIIENLNSKQSLKDLFIDLAAQTSIKKDIQKAHKEESSIVDQLGLDPIFDLIEFSSERDFEVGERYENSDMEGEIKSSNGVIEKLRKHKTCVLLGEAGAGKTTTLERIVLNAAEEYLDKREEVIPVYLKLSAWLPTQSFVDFIYSQWPFTSHPSTSLENGYAALYLDGLNEIGSNTDERIQQLREWLMFKPEAKKMIITCRTDDYFLGELDLNIPIIKIQSMGELRIRLFSKKYLASIGKDPKPFLSQLFRSNKDEKSSSLLKLASNPFMLTALVITYVKSQFPSDALPKNKGRLSKRLVEILWEREKTRNWSGWLPYSEVEPMFSRLAFQMVDGDNSIEIPTTEALQYCTLEIIQIARSASIIKIENENLKFYHQLIQEFFAAVELKNCESLKILQRPEIVDGQRKDSRWDQVIVALCGISESPDEIVNYALNSQDPYLAAICISSGIQVSRATIEQTVYQLLANIAVWEWADFNKRLNVIRKALSDIGKPAVPFLINFLESEKIVFVDGKKLAKGVFFIAGGTAAVAVTIVGAAAVITVLPQASAASLAAGAIPFAKGLSENKRFKTFVQESANKLSESEMLNKFIRSFREDSMNFQLKKALGLTPRVSGEIIKAVPEKIDEMELESIRKIGLMKLIISALGIIGDSSASSTLQKLSKNDPSKEVMEAAKLAIAEIQTRAQSKI